MLLGIWKNIEDLEDSLCLDELKIILESARERELRNQRFFAMVNGIDLQKAEAKQAEEDFMRVKRRTEAKLAGQFKSEEAYELNDFGFEIEEDE